MAFLASLAAFAVAQSITEFPIPTDDADSWDLCLGPDGAIWFNEPEPNKIGRIDMQGNITEFPTLGGAYGVAFGPDGNIWYTAGPNVGKMTTAGEVTVLPPLEPQDETFGAYPIVAGSDGNLWIGLLEGRIARITTAGAITYFTLGFSTPIPGIGGPYSLALGPDGNVWYALPTLDVVGKITPVGEVTNYSAPGNPLAIGAGPDGAIWFVGSGGAIVRITTQGDVQTIGQATGISEGVGTGPDGNIWFAEGGAEKLGRVTLSGAVTELNLPGPAIGFPHGPFDVLTGPDGNLWYVRRGENRIGRIELPSRRPPILPEPHTDHPRIVPPRRLENVRGDHHD